MLDPRHDLLTGVIDVNSGIRRMDDLPSWSTGGTPRLRLKTETPCWLCGPTAPKRRGGHCVRFRPARDMLRLSAFDGMDSV